ncbi:MAG: leucyl aminopeptidase [Buchnera aphidicola (Schlechtendalia peitan)]
MKYKIHFSNMNNAHSNCLIFGIFENSELFGFLKELDKNSNNYIKKLLKSQGIQGKIDQFVPLYGFPNNFSKKIILLGCGKKELFDVNVYKKIFKNSLNLVKNFSISSIDYFLPELNVKNLNIYWKIRFAIETIHNVLYCFDKFKTKQSELFSCLNTIIFNIQEHDDILLGKTAIIHGKAIATGIKYAKDLSNTPPNICNPSYLACKAQNLSLRYPNTINTEVIDHNAMKKLGMNAYLAVGRGSKNKPLMSIIKYNGNKKNDSKTIVFIGKGVTFDSGGISIKPSLHMDEMKYDMSGAAVVFGLMVIVSKLQLPLNVIGILASCENMISEKSLRPSDILTTMSGKTVEVLNTDAEGRLVLCDVLTYVEKFNPDIVIDIATLTGACVVALGNSVTGLMSNSSELSKNIEKAGEQTDDKVWNLPLFKEYYKSLKSDIADLNNTGGPFAGAITAACFLSEFSKKYMWAHLDIAGTAWTLGKRKSSTGRPISLLSQFLLNIFKTDSSI